jgi:hypothetical protein
VTVTYADILDDLNSIAAERSPWNIEAIYWLVAHGLAVKCTRGPPHNLVYYDLTLTGKNLYYNTLGHFKNQLINFKEAGQLNGDTQTNDSAEQQDRNAKTSEGTKGKNVKGNARAAR